LQRVGGGIDAVALKGVACPLQALHGRVAQALRDQHREDLDHRQVREVGVDADVHHRIVGHRQAKQVIGLGRKRRAGPRQRDHLGALCARNVDRVEQRRHAADMRYGDDHAARPLRSTRHLLQVVVRPGVGRQAEPEQARLQVACHEPRCGAGTVQVDVRRCSDGANGTVEHEGHRDDGFHRVALRAAGRRHIGFP